ncbi:hypothetical protein CBM2629_U10061 [Cupriavidus taiwanensis]|nr:hypothetical protein CBM2629_U10061 [Cupriavidus taiwanensis]
MDFAPPPASRGNSSKALTLQGGALTFPECPASLPICSLRVGQEVLTGTSFPGRRSRRLSAATR